MTEEKAVQAIQIFGEMVVREMSRSEFMVVFPLFLIGMALSLWKLRQIHRQISQSRTRSEDGSLRPLTLQEQSAVFHYLAFQRGRHFWHIIIVGMLLVALIVLTSLGLRITGILPSE